MQGFTVIDLVILIVYLAAVLFAGLHFAEENLDNWTVKQPWKFLKSFIHDSGRDSAGFKELTFKNSKGKIADVIWPDWTKWETI